jgi:phosphoribosylglycinamide formyltransferase 1
VKKLAIFASGTGSNAEALIMHFSNHTGFEIACLCTNKPDCGAVQIAQSHDIPDMFFSADEMAKGTVTEKLQQQHIFAIILAGFLRKIPENMIAAFPDKIINLHPALLPKFGGKGMYGMHVHQAVIEAGEAESGITIHLVNEVYDEGRVLAQFRTPVLPEMGAEALAHEVQKLEHEHFPKVVEQYLQGHAC